MGLGFGIISSVFFGLCLLNGWYMTTKKQMPFQTYRIPSPHEIEFYGRWFFNASVLGATGVILNFLIGGFFVIFICAAIMIQSFTLYKLVNG